MNYLTDQQYLSALHRIKKRIESGLPLKATDSDEIGDKFTDCSWGLCTMDAKVWPNEARMRKEPFSDGRVSSKYLQDAHVCPMDKEPAKGSMGCFYRCRVFQHSKAGRPKKEEAIALYQLTIKEKEFKG